MARTDLPANDSDRGKIYMAALEADVPVTPLFLAARTGVRPTSIGRHIQRLVDAGMLQEVGAIRVPIIPDLHPVTRVHRLYIAVAEGACRNEMSAYAPELYRQLLTEASELADSGERRLLLAILHRAAHDSLTQQSLAYFQPEGGMLALCDWLQINADWACAKWRKLYLTVVEDAKTAA